MCCVHVREEERRSRAARRRRARCRWEGDLSLRIIYRAGRLLEDEYIPSRLQWHWLHWQFWHFPNHLLIKKTSAYSDTFFTNFSLKTWYFANILDNLIAIQIFPYLCWWLVSLEISIITRASREWFEYSHIQKIWHRRIHSIFKDLSLDIRPVVAQCKRQLIITCKR